MRVAAVVSDLMFYSRIEAAAAAAGASLVRMDSPAELSLDDAFDLVLVDWSVHRFDWPDALRGRTASRIILFGRHTDLESHAAARDVGRGPMWARSKLLSALPQLLPPQR